MLKYSLTENRLTGRPDDYSAQAHSSSSWDKQAVINRMLSKGTLLTRTDIIAVLNNLEETTIDILKEGGTVHMPLFKTSFSISGVFDSPADHFDSERHKVNVNFAKGASVRQAEKEIKIEKTHNRVPMPQILEIKDIVSGSVNQQLTPNGVIELRGHDLRIDGETPDIGLWFIHENGSEIKADRLIENKPSRLLALIPALDSGRYQIKIVTLYSIYGKILKNPKEAVCSKALWVENP